MGRVPRVMGLVPRVMGLELWSMYYIKAIRPTYVRYAGSMMYVRYAVLNNENSVRTA
jgi:hypothetical protein